MSSQLLACPARLAAAGRLATRLRRAPASVAACAPLRRASTGVGGSDAGAGAGDGDDAERVKRAILDAALKHLHREGCVGRAAKGWREGAWRRARVWSP